jgi:hypothetical protein
MIFIGGMLMLIMAVLLNIDNNLVKIFDQLKGKP